MNPVEWWYSGTPFLYLVWLIAPIPAATAERLFCIMRQSYALMTAALSGFAKAELACSGAKGSGGTIPEQ
jgi:hypothetical protein